MSRISPPVRKKLASIAEVIAREKGPLHFFAVVQRSAVADRWDILVSAKKLKPWSIEAIRYIADLLQKRLSVGEIVQVARIVPLPRDNALVEDLSNSPSWPRGTYSGVHPLDEPTDFEVIWPMQRTKRQTQSA